MNIEDEARTLAGVAMNSLEDADTSFSVNPDFHGQEARIIEGAENILRSERVEGVTLSILAEGSIGINT